MKTFSFSGCNAFSEGHTLVIPKKEVDLIFDLDSEEFKELSVLHKR
jgi:histidine triad (HIT) family protein